MKRETKLTIASIVVMVLWLALALYVTRPPA